MNINMVCKNDYVLYRDVQDNDTLYKVLSAPKDCNFMLGMIGEFGELTKKQFETTMTRTTGSQRIFRTWLQKGDRVRVDTLNITGHVSMLSMSLDNNPRIFVQILSDKGGTYNIEISEAYAEVELLHG